MPAKTVAAETMEIGKKGGGKHWTAEEIAAREAAAAMLKRENLNLAAPEWLSSGALLIWKRIVDDAAKLGNGQLLDNLDVDMLANYCDANDKVQTLNKGIADLRNQKTGNDVKLLLQLHEVIDAEMKTLQGWYRVIATYADKLGFTPQARARLVKKQAEKNLKDKFGAEFDG